MCVCVYVCNIGSNINNICIIRRTYKYVIYITRICHLIFQFNQVLYFILFFQKIQLCHKSPIYMINQTCKKTRSSPKTYTVKKTYQQKITNSDKSNYIYIVLYIFCNNINIYLE